MKSKKKTNKKYPKKASKRKKKTTISFKSTSNYNKKEDKDIKQELVNQNKEDLRIKTFTFEQCDPECFEGERLLYTKNLEKKIGFLKKLKSFVCNLLRKKTL